MNSLWVVLLVSISTSLIAGEAAQAEEKVSFRKHIAPIFRDECTYCHMREEHMGYLVLEQELAYENLVDVPAYGYPRLKRVQPGEPDRSYLWLKLTGQHLAVGGKGWPMPYYPMVDEKRLLVHDWIVQGAKNN